MAAQAKARWTGQGLQFIASSWSNHGLTMDASEKVGGTDTGPRPMEVLLFSLAGCTGMDVVSLLKKMHVDFTGLEINIQAEMADKHPKVYTRIDLEYVVTGHNIDKIKLKKAIDLSQKKYCPVSEMLRKHCPVNYLYRTVET
ncbi:hypothetical protein CH330_08920 [candidate division WOR-3 bacterium JGI_Cruoil_03_51_56]|uniref:Osmotically inducible protein OsmC n=1 Tax=candidate division WOR-3 bacterium JGI_Cruoil_03_51_56 TaxID=1973747 RepID=A0A235BP86_UNCW3|nr:MAG: hypothetical protein CH330_08920 [candidate division WOR-3 bacterium JGI_Cruoil_03_51_56]